MTARIILLIASLSGFIAVALGAFGAHAMRNRLTPERLATWETAVQYQFYHTIALLIVALLMLKSPRPELSWSAWAFTIGTVIFSGSLYALCLTGVKGLGAVTPIGGLSFLAGWVLLALYAWRF